MEKELFLKLYNDGYFDFDYFNVSQVCSRELCKFYNDIIMNLDKNFDKKDAIYDLVSISIMLNKLYFADVNNKEHIEYLSNLVPSSIRFNKKSGVNYEKNI